MSFQPYRDRNFMRAERDYLTLPEDKPRNKRRRNEEEEEDDYREERERLCPPDQTIE